MTSEINIGITDIRRITEALKLNKNLDISWYALMPLKNRLERFFSQIGGTVGIDYFISKIKTDENYYNNFLKNLSVEKTEIFRNPSVWRYTRDKLLPEILTYNSKINVWFPFTTTLEDLYSFLIVLKEKSLTDYANIKVTFLFDVWLRQTNTYEITNQKLELCQFNYQRFNDKGNLSNYFIFNATGFSFKKNLFENVNIVYDVHSFEEDDSIDKFNLIICRDFLIYTNITWHERFFSLMDSKLQRNSHLVLGVKEQISFCKDAKKYVQVSGVEGVFKKQSLL